VDSVLGLTKGNVYFTIFYPDDDMKYPTVCAYVYLGSGLHGGAKNKHYFQTTDSYFDVGNWAAMSDAERRGLGPGSVVTCDEKDLDGFAKNVDEFIAELAGLRGKWKAGS